MLKCQYLLPNVLVSIILLHLGCIKLLASQSYRSNNIVNMEWLLHWTKLLLFLLTINHISAIQQAISTTHRASRRQHLSDLELKEVWWSAVQATALIQRRIKRLQLEHYQVRGKCQVIISRKKLQKKISLDFSANSSLKKWEGLTHWLKICESRNSL